MGAEGEEEVLLGLLTLKSPEVGAEAAQAEGLEATAIEFEGLQTLFER